MAWLLVELIELWKVSIYAPVWGLVLIGGLIVIFVSLAFSCCRLLPCVRKLEPSVPIDPDDLVPMACLGRWFELGMLYDYSKDHLLSADQMVSSPHNITTQTKDFGSDDMYEVITDDSLSSKLCHLGAEDNLKLNLVIGLFGKTSRSAEYLEDVRMSRRQARVVLRYKCYTKYKELKMVSGEQEKKLGAKDSATHVVVGVEYGAEAYFVFDKEVPDHEDYDETCRQMELLVKILPGFTKNKKQLSKEQKLLADQLQCTLYSDIPSRDPENFEDAAQICNRIIPGFATMDIVVPKKAWLYPLDKKGEHIKRHHAEKVLELLDRLHNLHLKIHSLLKHEVCESFDCIFEQLLELNKLIIGKRRTLKEKIRALIPRIQQKQSIVTKLEVLIDKAENQINSIEKWLDGKEMEISQISEYLMLLNTPGVTLHLSREKFNWFARREGGTCIISLEFEFYQSQVIDPEKLINHPFSSDVKSKIETFTSFARTCNEAKCVVTVSDNHTPWQQGVAILLYDPDSSEPTEFKLPTPVGKPTETELKSWDWIKIKWVRPPEPSDAPIGHTVFFKTVREESWMSKFVDGDFTEAEIDGLTANTAYVFKVAAKYKYGHGPESLVSCAITTSSAPLPVKIKRDEALSEKHPQMQGSKETFKLKTNSTLNDRDKMIARVEFGMPQPSKHTKVIMVMGATGAGKSTLINAMANYILGVDYHDEFRFILICDETKESQAHSQTSLITAYTFYWQEGFNVEYNLVIIDTPGFGDTRGIEQDDRTVAQIRELFSVKGENNIDQIHTVGFVVQASQVRLTAGQKYIFDSVLSIFGNDVKGNIFIMATFADNDEPKVMDALTEAEVPHADVFTFNNSALYAQSKGIMTESYWKIGYKSLQKFFDHLVQINVISLSLTRQVLDERKKLEIILSGLQPKIQDITLKVESLKTEEEILASICSDMKASESYKYKVKITKQRQVNLKHGTYVTNCSICSFTCHRPCSISNDTKKYDCSAMDKNGESGAKCTVCPKKCRWQDHYNNPYFFESYEVEETRTAEDLKKRYNIAENDKEGAQNALSKLHDELDNLAKKIYADIHEARRCKERLSEMALKPHPMSDVEYIEVLIEAEKNEKKEGSEGRVELYSKMKHQAEIMKKFSNKEIAEELKKEKEEWWRIFVPDAVVDYFSRK